MNHTSCGWSSEGFPGSLPVLTHRVTDTPEVDRRLAWLAKEKAEGASGMSQTLNSDSTTLVLVTLILLATSAFVTSCVLTSTSGAVTMLTSPVEPHWTRCVTGQLLLGGGFY